MNAAKQSANLRPYPPAPVGNDRGREHGGFALVPAERRDEHVEAVFDALGAVAPLREQGELPAADRALIAAAAECHARLTDVREFIDANGAFDSRKRMRPAVLVEAKLRREFVSYLTELGATPRSRARLGVDVKAAHVDVATAMSEPDPVIRAQLLRRLGVIDNDAIGGDADEH